MIKIVDGTELYVTNPRDPRNNITVIKIFFPEKLDTVVYLSKKVIPINLIFYKFNIVLRDEVLIYNDKSYVLEWENGSRVFITSDEFIIEVDRSNRYKFSGALSYPIKFTLTEDNEVVKLGILTKKIVNIDNDKFKILGVSNYYFQSEKELSNLIKKIKKEINSSNIIRVYLNDSYFVNEYSKKDL